MMNEEIIIKKPTSMKVKKISIIIGCVLFLGIILFLSYLPLFVISMVSFSNEKTGIDMIGFTTKWYVKIFTDDNIRESILFTLEITLLATIISTIFGTLSAIGINSLKNKTRKKMIILNNVPILNADIVTAVFLLIIFQVISIIIQKNILGFWTTLIAHVLFSTPYVVLSVLPKLRGIDDNMFDAAIDLGCNPRGALLKVIIPSIKSGVFSGMLLAFTMSIDDFIISYFVSGEKNNFSTWLYSNLKTMRNGQWNAACAYNTLLLFITLTGVISFQIISSKKKKEKNNEKN